MDQKSESLLIDESMIKQLENDTSSELMPSMIKIFIEELNRRVNSLAACIEKELYDQIEKESHALKSSAKTFGAVKIADLASEIDTLCKNGSFSLVSEKTRLLLEHAEPTVTELTNKYL